MIITKQKDLDLILKRVKNSVFIVGCSECATICKTGGEKEVKDMKKQLESNKIMVSGCTILDPACHYNNNKRILKNYKNELQKSDTVLVLACGNGVQTVSELLEGKTIISGTDTLFLGEIKRANRFEKRCNMCGECLLDVFGGFCPVTRCPKSMLNGPCGGSKNGKCEVNQEYDCIWEKVYKHLKKAKELDLFNQIQKPKEWSKSKDMWRDI